MEAETLVLPGSKAKRKRSRNARGVFEKVPGSCVWWIRYVDASGRFRREKIGTFSAAEKLYCKRKQQALEGRKLPEALRKRAVSFCDLADDAKTYVQGRYSRPADDVARIELLKTRLVGRADAITAAEVENLLDCLTIEKRWSASTRNHYQNLVSLAYRLGILHAKVKENAVRGLRRKTENNCRVRFLTPAEEKSLREVIRAKPEWAEHEPELDLALHSGLRRRDMYRHLLWENVDFISHIDESGKAYPVAKIVRSKNGDSVYVPLNRDAMRALAIFRSRGDGSGRVVRNLAGEPLNFNAHWFPQAIRAAEIKDFRWHDLRHTYASRLRQSGVPLGNIAELLGHRGLAMTRRYAHLSISNLHDAVSRIQTDTTVAPAPITRAPAPSRIQ
jgi:integrase